MDQNQNSTSITMDLENLKQQYSNLLLQYKSAVTDYINYLNVQSQQPCGSYTSSSKGIDQACYNQELVSIQGQAFNGTGSAGQSSATTLQDCIASCSNSDTCTGATFISNKCEIRTGDSPIVPSSNNSYAIIPKGKQLLLNMENINQQLLDVNKELVGKIQISEPAYNQQSSETTSKNQELIQNYQNLIQEREKIAEILNQYETLDNTDNENQIKITQNYYSYILLFILAIAFIFLLYKIIPTNATQVIQYGGELGSNAYYMVFGLIIFIIILNFAIKYLSL